MSSAGVNQENSLIPLEEIRLATQNFSSESLIRDGQYSKVYKGILSESWPYRTVAIKRRHAYCYVAPSELENELKLVSSLKHDNIIPFVGYNDHDKRENIIVSKYAENGSLDQQLRKGDWLSWARLLKICVGAARGLEYLHSGLGGQAKVIHGDFKTSNILLDEKLEARICGFDFSILIDQNQPPVHNCARGSLLYMDPIYYEEGFANPKSDVYSFGVVLFEMLSAMLEYNGQVLNYVQPQTLINLVGNCDDDKLEKLLKPDVRKDMAIRSFRVFKDIAYKCISLELKEPRPTMSVIVKKLEDALAIQEEHRAASTISTRGEPYEIPKSFLIPVKEISLAIGYLSQGFRMVPKYDLGKFYDTHQGRLSERWQNREAIFKCFDHDGSSVFSCEVSMFLRFKNENVIRLIGFCEHENNSFLVLEYAVNGSLDDHLCVPKKRPRVLKWAERLKICIGAARGLKYLHSGLGEDTKVIHGKVKSAMILLDGNLEAKISDFCFSELVDEYKPHNIYRGEPDAYMDPLSSSISKTKADVYSFGVVLFEILSGMLADEERGIGGLKNLIDPNIKDEINNDSLRAFMKIANRCISSKIKDRPMMNRVLSRIEEARDIQLYSQKHGVASTIATRSQELESYQIPLEEIILATNDFGQDTLIGAGGFGKVYEGKLPERRKKCTVAIKKLDDQSFQGDKEFQNELKLIFKFHHENIIPFVGYYDKGNMKIIITEYARNRSLDHHLRKSSRPARLTWAQRLKICLGAAKGLNYLHSGPGKDDGDDGVIHRDVKSANILLDENMVAKICALVCQNRNQTISKVPTSIQKLRAPTSTWILFTKKEGC